MIFFMGVLLVFSRWRPLHYQLRSSIFADQLATCNTGGACFVTNSAPFAFKGKVSVRLLNVASGESAQLTARAREALAPSSSSTQFLGTCWSLPWVFGGIGYGC